MAVEKVEPRPPRPKPAKKPGEVTYGKGGKATYKEGKRASR
jgi:hypothetical protein